MSAEADLRAAKKVADTQLDIQRWHDVLLDFVEADEKAREVWHNDLREAVGMLSHLALKGALRP